MTPKKLTAEQRYRQATQKALIRGRRNLRLFFEGKIAFLPGSDPRADLVSELARAYKAGFHDGRRYEIDAPRADPESWGNSTMDWFHG